MLLITDPRIMEAIAPACHHVTLAYPDGVIDIAEVWSIDDSATAVFGLLDQWRDSIGSDAEFVGLKRVEYASVA